MRLTLLAPALAAAALLVTGCSSTPAESEPVVIAQKQSFTASKATATESVQAANSTPTATPVATPETNNRGAIIKQIGEPFGVLNKDDTKLIQMTVDRIQRITAAECPNASNPYITINDPGEGFAILDLTVQTFTNPPTFPEPLSPWDWYTVDNTGRVKTEVGTDNSAMSCAMSDSQDMSNLMPNSTYSKRIIVPVASGTEYVGYEWTDGVDSAQWEWTI
ncbi:hypothetical protein [Rhodococcus ruber]|uniref:hypothetical protein n=1 Tax=Rhodococcus ruber TaxID=1830 RepID=UPI00378350C8